MTIHFIGAGPGAPDLITVRGQDLVARCPVCLFAGSLVPREIVALCPPGARVIDTAPLDLDAIIAECVAADAAGLDVARLHSGDLSIWSAMGEQLRRLDALGIPYTVTPGVPSFAAAAAVLGRELTLPGVAQTVVLTRTSGRASAMPPRENLAAYAATGATLAIHLSIHVLAEVVTTLLPHYGADGAVAVVVRASWPDQVVIRATLATITAKVADAAIERTALILVGPALAAEDFADSALYAADYDRRFRPNSQTGVVHE
ncbi:MULTISPECIES: precorrin-4 C(11)-methyltransferase [Rhodopseudomonas]|uniref:Precorrin-4 C11-methyltransferase n=1 Tax=Rhodopseudomonas palustris TaxID=1076 RepID=A0A0D7E039_RHOPL|nr:MULTISPECIES: precorrin-4 C(11)-methyltransferase [Rhodopseudomonas]KIZ33876.1 precorrin-4 C11-methyltransferase [Rhodopseudomonas palustris]MDF3814487.1 precorrin-4 C(11)-methyltransferase [Rhodopseudomonas sp. BAL398]WOK18851.1 precorrin-4 C(11)-methyltransferase [Rhodopseudomonas sp. BAL398]